MIILMCCFNKVNLCEILLVHKRITFIYINLPEFGKETKEKIFQTELAAGIAEYNSYQHFVMAYFDSELSYIINLK